MSLKNMELFLRLCGFSLWSAVIDRQWVGASQTGFYPGTKYMASEWAAFKVLRTASSSHVSADC